MNSLSFSDGQVGFDVELLNLVCRLIISMFKDNCSMQKKGDFHGKGSMNRWENMLLEDITNCIEFKFQNFKRKTE